MAKKGLDLHRDADDLYARYKKADVAEEASHLYSLTNKRDVKSQVSWALSAAFAVSGVRFSLHRSSEQEQRRRTEWFLSALVERRGMELGLGRAWRFL